MKNLSHYLLLFITVALASCARPAALQYKGVDRVFIGSASTKGLQLGLDLKLYNPNDYAMTFRDADLKAFINSRPAGSAQMLSSQEVPARDTFILPVTIALDINNVLGNAVDLLTQREVNVKLEGTVRAGKGGFTLPVRVRYEGRQKLQF